MIFQKKKEIYDNVASRGFETPESVQPKKLSLFDEESGHRVQNDKVIEVEHACNKAITENLVLANKNPKFAANYKSITKYKVRKLIKLISMESEKIKKLPAHPNKKARDNSDPEEEKKEWLKLVEFEKVESLLY